MKYIDINNWKGKKHYLWFKEYAQPYYGITSKIDITKFFNHIKNNNLPFFASLTYLITKALNEIEEFRLRIVDERVVIFDIIHPAFTIMTNDRIFDNCEVQLDEFPKYLKDIKEKIEDAKLGIKEDVSYNDKTRYDQYYISSLPWIDFTSTSHPMTDNKEDSVPRVVWGKYNIENDKVTLSLGIQVNHALVDGYPLSLGFLKIQEYVNNPDMYLV